ncbi:helix-turn-helix domain-containing protein [Streptomyces humi]|uniref:helix-turn-helix domain-containing protein n=1 Tax=Streptomyces humi TaxID=1428620 RepID=UPI0006289111|nr:pyridoxamine 5'-phosphate oxidase family protein [Streptomyces humi]
MAEQVHPGRVERPPLGDLGRRLMTRRLELGLTRRETAVRAGVAPGYLQYLEENPLAAPGTGALLRLAEVLHTTLTHLTGGDTETPPGSGRAAHAPEFAELSPAQCMTLLGTHGVGRLGVPTAGGPVIVPVNYSVVEGAIVYRTAPGTTPALAAGHRVAFETDRIDDTFSEGWSVLVQGRAHTVTEPDEIHRLTASAHSTPWAGGRRDLWMRVEPDVVTGRRIRA